MGLADAIKGEAAMFEAEVVETVDPTAKGFEELFCALFGAQSPVTDRPD